MSVGNNAAYSSSYMPQSTSYNSVSQYMPDIYGMQPNSVLGTQGSLMPQGSLNMSSLYNGGYQTSQVNQDMASYFAKNPIASNGGPGGGLTTMEKWLGGSNNAGNYVPGMALTGLNALTGVAGAYIGWQQFKTAQDSLKENKRQFNLNYEASKKNYNTTIEDRQRARVASNPNAYQSVSSYMSKNGI